MKGFLTIWLIVFIFVLIAGGGVLYVYKNNQVPVSSFSSTSTQPSPKTALSTSTTSTIVSTSTQILSDTKRKTLIVINPHPYSSTDTLYIFDFWQGTKPVAKIATKLNSDDRRSGYTLVGDRIYFLSSKDGEVKWIDFSGNIHSLNYTRASHLTYAPFLVSPDNQRISWVETTFPSNLESKSVLYIADINGENKKILLEKTFYGEQYFRPVRWSNSGKELYYSEEKGGLGGYIIFWGYFNLSKIDAETEKVTTLFGKNGLVKDFNYISDISPDEKFVSYFTGGAGAAVSRKLGIFNIGTRKETFVDIPLDEGFRGGGNAFFSPDSQRLAYNIAHWDEGDEEFRTMLLEDLNNGRPKIIIDDKQNLYSIDSWGSNSKLILSSIDSWYTLDLSNHNLEKIETQ